MQANQPQAVASVALPELALPVTAVSSANSARILIVDDNEINRRILAGMLRKERYTLLSAADGEQALAMACGERPDLILLDIMMPGKDGYQVCGELKADPRTERVPVIVLSALSETADKIKGLELGAVDYITKPFDQGEVLARVRSQLKIQRLTTELLRANRALQDKQLGWLDREYPMERFDKYFTIAYALVDHRAGRLRYSLGGHPQPVLLRADGRIEVLDAGGPLIGLGAMLGFDEAEVALQPADRLLLYTDGVVELTDPTGAPFGEERLYRAVHAARGLPLEAACDPLVEPARAFAAGSEPLDDITLLALEFTGAGGNTST